MCFSQFLFVFTERYQALVAWHSFFSSRLIPSTALLTSPAEEGNHCEKLNEIKSDKKTFIVGALCLWFISSWNSRHSACYHSSKRPAQVTTSVWSFTRASRGTQRLFSVKYLLGEADVALNFLLLEDGQKFLDDRSIPVDFRSLSNKFPMIF